MKTKPTFPQRDHSDLITYAIVLLALIAIFYFTSCKKEETKPQPQPSTHSNCTVDMNLFSNIVWNNVDTSLARREFFADGIYQENGINMGTWQRMDGCSTIFVSRTDSLDFYFKIVYVNSDTMKIQNISGGQTPYYVYFN